MGVNEAAVQPGKPAVRKESWLVRSIGPSELPAVCRYCRPRRCQEQVVAVIAFRILDVYGSGVQVVREERSAPVCVDHGVYVQQKYIIGKEA